MFNMFSGFWLYEIIFMIEALQVLKYKIPDVYNLSFYKLLILQIKRGILPLSTVGVQYYTWFLRRTNRVFEPIFVSIRD